jgi:hypothetical protein
LFVISRDDEGEEDTVKLNPLLPSLIPDFEDEIDYQTIMASIAEEVQHDEIANAIFKGICRDRLSRSEVIELENIPPKEFDKGKKRLETIINKVARKYNIHKSP